MLKVLHIIVWLDLYVHVRENDTSNDLHIFYSVNNTKIM